MAKEPETHPEWLIRWRAVTFEDTLRHSASRRIVETTEDERTFIRPDNCPSVYTVVKFQDGSYAAAASDYCMEPREADGPVVIAGLLPVYWIGLPQLVPAKHSTLGLPTIDFTKEDE